MSKEFSIEFQFELTAYFEPTGVQVDMYMDGRDNDIFNANIPYSTLLEKVVEYNSIGSSLCKHGVEELLQIRESLQNTILEIDQLVLDASVGEPK